MLNQSINQCCAVSVIVFVTVLSVHLSKSWGHWLRHTMAMDKTFSCD